MRYYLRLLILILTFHTFLAEIILPAQDRIDLIVIDPGHGGRDAGCSAYNHKEKELTLEISQAIGKKVKEEFKDIDIIYTRETDIFVPLHERIGIANKMDADLFISIHINALASGEATGIESYVLGIEAEDEHLDIVIRENASIAFEKDSSQEYLKFDLHSTEARIIMSTYQQNYLDKSIRFANQLQQSTHVKTQLKDRGVRQAPFVVLRMANMPAVLFECGFITNENDLRCLSDKTGIDRIAESFIEALKNYIYQFQQAYSKEPNIFVASNPLPAHQSMESTDQKWLDNGQYQLRIQVMTSLNKPIGKEDPIWETFQDLEEIKELEVYNYLTGNFNSLEKARLALTNIRKSGYPGAYLVALNGSERISLK